MLVHNPAKEFALKWIEKFQNPNINYLELVDGFLADDCAALGFQMDCGHAFESEYGAASYDPVMLKRVINSVSDIQLLGSAIYSRWRYFNHWAYNAAEILEQQNRDWFIIALQRLSDLSEQRFIGTPKRMRLISNNWCYGPMPNPEDEIEQHLSVNDKGRVWFSVYAFGELGIRHPKVRSSNYKIEPQEAERLLHIVADYFREPYEEIFATDVGDWKILITNTEGEEFVYKGSLCADLVVRNIDLSDLLRDVLGIDDLYAFDGNCKPDQITRIAIDYHKVTVIGHSHPPEEVSAKHLRWNYAEQLVIDRKTETIEYIQQIGTGCKVSRKYEVEGGIESLLDNFDADSLFSKIDGNPKDVIENPDDSRDYTIAIDYKKRPRQLIAGSFDKNGLPNDFADFASEVLEFIRFYGAGEILDPAVYQKTRRRRGDFIFCSVEFENGYKTYYYLTDDDSIKIGDYVVVPAGKDNHHAVVEVVDIEYFAEEDTPLPIEKTKRILRKCTDEDLVAPEDGDEDRVWCPVASRELTEIDCIEICDVANHMLKEDVLNSFSPPIEWNEEKRTQCRCCPYHIGN